MRILDWQVDWNQRSNHCQGILKYKLKFVAVQAQSGNKDFDKASSSGDQSKEESIRGSRNLGGRGRNTKGRSVLIWRKYNVESTKKIVFLV